MRTIVITGAAHRGQLGELIARRFAEAGDAVVLLDRNAAEAEARAGELRADGLRAVAHGVDLTDAETLRRVAEHVGAKAEGGIAALVHGAGGFAASGPLAESDPRVFQGQLTVNLVTAYMTTRALLPLVRSAQGSIIYVAAAAALPEARPAGLSAYVAAKAGVLALMRAVAAEERESGVRANAIAPTAIRTTANEAAMGADTHYVERETIADVVTWLASPAAQGVTGQVLRLG